jgi:(R,R)-butanediol dehydrogenase/meso-butanediol dehydrogenase/diacetyl reductase
MRAYRIHGREDLRLEAVPEPTPGPDEVKVRIAYNGICGTDVDEFYDGPVFVPQEPHPVTGRSAPLTLGHEASGVIAEVGNAVTGLKPGDRVAIEPLIHPTGATGHSYNVGPGTAFYGFMADGMLADFAVVKAANAHRIPDALSLADAALAEPLAVGLHAVGRVELGPGDSAVVFGAGPIGLATLLALRTLELERTFLVSRSAERRRLGEELGAAGLDPDAVDVGAAVAELSGGLGARAAFECTGFQIPFDNALGCLAPHGTLVTIAIYGSDLAFNPNTILTGEQTITASLAYAGEFPRVISLLESGAFPAAGWVGTIGFEEVLSAGLPVLREGGAIKLLVEIGGG